MDNNDDRVSELIAAAVAGELTPEETAELDALRRRHPWVDDEIASLRTLVARLDEADLTWSEVTPGSDLRDRVEAVAVPNTSSTPSSVRRRGSRWVVTLLGAAACIGIGVGAGIVVPAALSAPPIGPPGTLGAVEHVDVRDESAATAIDADLVAHTWGTEAVVDAEGLDVGATYSIVFIGTGGEEFSAGEMLGSSVAIHCRVNAAVLREDVQRLEIRDATGDPIAAAEVPNV